MRLFPYHLRLAASSLRRDLGMSLVMLVALAVGTSVWTLAVTQYLRFRGLGVHLPATLYPRRSVVLCRLEALSC